MGSTQVIRTLEAVQIAEAAPELREMLERVVDAGDLPDYSEISPSPFVAGQNLITNLDRIGRDRAVDTNFAMTMYLGALVKICQAQQERIEALEAKVSRGRQPAQAASKT